ncbi:rhodanese-like domain-containing protein [Stenotrophomonas sp. HITSZ_GD]|uniref:rhodanese-like domain-containing protein n=1 Tax=Stenotrophomonas sp. HITSZ_GD TaxID=3037248 RepID=UPI00240E85EE|nr:rhodanese-like domain-containing protein [Stenotrophomonas sp. HITSZ_GD]MDG2523920.1 rhodanese-like domain-containing protein [Stenotrophomonas sp. HITSZ_GD]
MNFEELLAFAGRNPFLSIVFVGLTIAIIYTEIARLFRGFAGIKPAELTRLMNGDGAVVVDLSPAADFEKGHIAGSRNAQPSQFGPEHKLVAGAKQKPVVLVCRTGNASTAAAKQLKKAGFEKVYVLEGGIPAWQQAELPLVKGRA